MEELAKKQGLKPNLQLFAEEGKTIWSKIKSTANKLEGTEIPATFQMDLAEDIKYINPETKTNLLWTNANATKHMKEYIKNDKFSQNGANIGIRSQTMLKSYYEAVNEAMREFVKLEPGKHRIVCGLWQLEIDTKTGVVNHARLIK